MCEFVHKTCFPIARMSLFHLARHEPRNLRGHLDPEHYNSGYRRLICLIFTLYEIHATYVAVPSVRVLLSFLPVLSTRSNHVSTEPSGSLLLHEPGVACPWRDRRSSCGDNVVALVWAVSSTRGVAAHAKCGTMQGSILNISNIRKI